MRVLLINPADAEDPAQRRLGNYMPPLSLMYLASALRRDGHDCRILDLYSATVPPDPLETVRCYAPGLIGIAAYSPTLDEAYSLARSVKAASPSTRIVFGGTHASYLPHACLRRDDVDCVVIGEGEQTLCELAAAFERGGGPSGIAGIAYCDGERVVVSPPRPLIDDLDSLPWPAYDLVDFDDYRLAPTRAVLHRRVSSILTARGCQYRCSFCSHHYGYDCRVRKRRLDEVVREMAHVRETYGVEEFRFEDCSLTSDPKRVIELCRLMRESRLGAVWNCDVRAETASEELFAAMRAAGCRRVFLGVESGSQAILSSLAMQKGITLAQAAKTVRLAKAHRMRINCSFVIGVPGETRESALRTFDFARELDPDYAMFTALAPSVGSRLFEQAVSQGKIDADSYRGGPYLAICSGQVPLVQMAGLKPGELSSLIERFNREFYFRPRYLLRRLAGIRSWREAAGLVWGALFVLRHRFGAIHGWLEAARCGRRQPCAGAKVG